MHMRGQGGESICASTWKNLRRSSNETKSESLAFSELHYHTQSQSYQKAISYVLCIRNFLFERNVIGPPESTSFGHLFWISLVFYYYSGGRNCFLSLTIHTKQKSSFPYFKDWIKHLTIMLLRISKLDLTNGMYFLFKFHADASGKVTPFPRNALGFFLFFSWWMHPHTKTGPLRGMWSVHFIQQQYWIFEHSLIMKWIWNL